jgi:hypothetical protein
MSTESVRQVITRAVNEPEYRNLLFKSPAQALEGYALSGDEQARLGQLNADGFDAVAGTLDERISQVFFMFGTGDAFEADNKKKQEAA